MGLASQPRAAARSFNLTSCSTPVERELNLEFGSILLHTIIPEE
jgi:hypothetical protein